MKKVSLFVALLGIGLAAKAMEKVGPSVEQSVKEQPEWPVLHSAVIAGEHGKEHFNEILEKAKKLSPEERKALVNEQFEGTTPLHLTLAWALDDKPDLALEQAKALVEAGADPELRNMFGQTPLEEAKEDQDKYPAMKGLVEYFESLKKPATEEK